MSDDRSVELPPSLRAAVMDRRGCPRSHELASAILVLAMLGAFLFLLPQEWSKYQKLMYNALSTCALPELEYSLMAAAEWWQFAAVFAVIWMAAVLAMGIQGGLRWRPQAVAPSMNRFAGMQPWRLESLSQSLWSAIAAILRLGLLVAVGVTWLWCDYPTAVLQAASPTGQTPWQVLFTGLIRGLAIVAIAWLVLGVVDYAIRVMAFRRTLRVSGQEWRDALRALSGNPEVRRLRRDHQLRRRQP